MRHPFIAITVAALVVMPSAAVAADSTDSGALRYCMTTGAKVTTDEAITPIRGGQPCPPPVNTQAA